MVLIVLQWILFLLMPLLEQGEEEEEGGGQRDWGRTLSALEEGDQPWDRPCRLRLHQAWPLQQCLAKEEEEGEGVG